jgi:flavin-dependent dehydrogenase
MTAGFTSQKRIEELPDQIWDVAIAGAGPAGGSLAASLAAKGHTVLLIDREAFPRDKICGDLIATYIYCRLRELGVYESVCREGHELRRSVIYEKSYDLASPDFFQAVLKRSDEIPDTLTGSIILKRSVLDGILAEKAVENGSTFVKGNVTRIASMNGMAHLLLEGSDKTIQCRITVVATGADVRLLKSLGMVEDTKASAVAIRCYIQSDCGIEDAIFYRDSCQNPAGYSWIFPMGSGLFNTGCMTALDNGRKTNLRKVLTDFFSSFPPARELLENGKIISGISGGKSRWGLTKMSGSGPENVMATGESIGSTSRGVGEGIARAILSSQIASDVIDEALKTGDSSLLREYPSLLRTKLRACREADSESSFL